MSSIYERPTEDLNEVQEQSEGIVALRAASIAALAGFCRRQP